MIHRASVLLAILLSLSACVPARLPPAPTVAPVPTTGRSPVQVAPVQVAPTQPAAGQLASPAVSGQIQSPTLAPSPAALTPAVRAQAVPEPATPTPMPPPASPAAHPPASAASGWIALIGLDGNVWLRDANTGASKQVTEDGNGSPQAGTAPTSGRVNYYCCSSWSSDGKLLAFRSTTVDDTGGATQYQLTIWVYDLVRGELRPVLKSGNPSGLAFRPDTHVLAYDVALDVAYFTPGTGKPDAARARGIMGVNADIGETGEFVKPVQGLWLSAPRWSPDGNLLGFVEQTRYEGPTPFAVYNFENKTYAAWNREIGNYTFAPDGKHIAYDRLSREGFTGDERIWISDVKGQGEQALSPGASPMAIEPAWSPQGDLVAYKLGEPANVPGHVGNILVVQPAPGAAGEVRRLGSFGYMGPLAWSPDGTRLAFKTGPYNAPAIKVVAVADGTVKDLGMGYDPAWQPGAAMQAPAPLANPGAPALPPYATVTPTPVRTPGPTPSVDIVVDDADPGTLYVGAWFAGDGGASYQGGCHWAPPGPNFATFWPKLPVAGSYEIYAWGCGDPNHDQVYSTHVTIYPLRSGLYVPPRAFVDLKDDPGRWVSIGVYYMEPGARLAVGPWDTSDWDAGNLAVDAFRFVFRSPDHVDITPTPAPTRVPWTNHPPSPQEQLTSGDLGARLGLVQRLYQYTPARTFESTTFDDCQAFPRAGCGGTVGGWRATVQYLGREPFSVTYRVSDDLRFVSLDPPDALRARQLRYLSGQNGTRTLNAYRYPDGRWYLDVIDQATRGWGGVLLPSDKAAVLEALAGKYASVGTGRDRVVTPDGWELHLYGLGTRVALDEDDRGRLLALVGEFGHTLLP